MHSTKRHKIPLIRLFVLLAFLPFYMGSTYLTSESAHMGFIYFELIVGGISFLLLVIKKFRWSMTRITALFLIMYFYLFVITVMRNADSISLFRQILSLLYILFIMDLFRDNMEDVFIPLQWFLGVLIVINVISLILYPEGLSTVIVPEGGYSILYFLGHDNSHIIYLLPCFIISEYRVITNYEKDMGINVWSRFFQIAVILNVLIAHVGATIIWFLIFVVLYNIFKVRTFGKKGLVVVFIAIPVALNVFMVFMQRQLQLVTIFAQQFLGKSATLSGRFFAWENSLNRIMQKPLTGHGYYGNRTMPDLIGYQQAHNLILQLALIGGIILVAIYVYILIALFKRFELARNNSIKAMGWAALVAYLIYAVAESQFNYKMLIFIPILWYMVEQKGEHTHKLRIKLRR